MGSNVDLVGVERVVSGGHGKRDGLVDLDVTERVVVKVTGDDGELSKDADVVDSISIDASLVVDSGFSSVVFKSRISMVDGMVE